MRLKERVAIVTGGAGGLEKCVPCALPKKVLVS